MLFSTSVNSPQIFTIMKMDFYPLVYSYEREAKKDKMAKAYQNS